VLAISRQPVTELDIPRALAVLFLWLRASRVRSAPVSRSDWRNAPMIRKDQPAGGRAGIQRLGHGNQRDLLFLN
jgi:hypothetical protein